MAGTPTASTPAGPHRHLLAAAQKGDHAAETYLLRRYEPLVRRVVWQLRLPFGCERDDLAQEARIGLLAAIRAWRPERGPFPPFADRCVRNQALLAVHAAGRYKHQVLSRAISLNAPYGGDATARDRASLTLVDTLAGPDGHADPEARLLAAEQLRYVVRALPTLTPAERRALTASANGEPYEHLASVLGGSAKAVERAAYRARRKFAYAHSEAA